VTIIHCDKERLHALYLRSVAKEFPSEKQKEAEKIFEELGKETPDNLFYAPLGEIENQGLRYGAKRFWYIYKEEEK
jgi:hypothetical protein